jgi:superfamily I DNA/RNA helicase
MVYIYCHGCCLPRLSLNPNDDPAFERVLNVPPRRLGAKLLQQLREEQEQMLASGRDTLLEQSQLQQQQQQAEGAQAQEHSLYSTAWRLLRSGDIATLHAKKLQAFLETLQVPGSTSVMNECMNELRVVCSKRHCTCLVPPTQ